MCQDFLCNIYSSNILYRIIIPGLPHILGLNAAIIVICVLFAIFMPNIGTVLRFSGAACGLTIIFALPILVYLASQQREEAGLSKLNITAHAFIVLLGLANFIAQFFIWTNIINFLYFYNFSLHQSSFHLGNIYFRHCYSDQTIYIFLTRCNQLFWKDFIQTLKEKK